MHATRHPLPDARWHFQHGPIDLVIGAEGEAGAVAAAHERAWQRFEPLLPELVAELPALRQPVGTHCPLQGPVARRMWQACQPLAQQFITPMAAVAGAVAQEIVAAYAVPGVRRAWVNNGGDIALHLQPGERVRIGLYADLARLDARQCVEGLQLDGQMALAAEWPVRGVATSGWRGRSHSLGIADSVTVLAATAAQADAAATVIANAVDVAHAGIVRVPACELRDDSDLGHRPVTVQVPPLPPDLLRQALHQGLKKAEELRASGLVWFALLTCQQQAVSTARPPGVDALAHRPQPSAQNSVGSVFA
ncbi:UPF0280 family protein [Curvibacter sp. HBC61]|uniref:UPF0280 family protein n=1 Tax=Curvibacter cyanobacteriorum TaxID=3026422 RepID=A0ABT5N448_9BURK|nr:UPF0280 family protein [Curvibacter sp. HBC61]MDD0840324.1 UPF0280 family protein [Curvibacter sp. HBC61]